MRATPGQNINMSGCTQHSTWKQERVNYITTKQQAPLVVKAIVAMEIPVLPLTAQKQTVLENPEPGSNKARLDKTTLL